MDIELAALPGCQRRACSILGVRAEHPPRQRDTDDPVQKRSHVDSILRAERDAECAGLAKIFRRDNLCRAGKDVARVAHVA